MSNPFAKTRPQHQPYAIYRMGSFEWRVCKTYSKDPLKPYGRFFVWARSPMTFGSFEGIRGWQFDSVMGHQSKCGISEVVSRNLAKV